MSKLLIATTNQAQYDEFARYLRPHGFTPVPLRELGITTHPVEDAETFEENSLLKANFYWKASGVATLTDDGGLEVAALGNQPGVHSRRIDGRERTDEELVKAILERLQNVPEQERQARLRIVVTLRVDDDRNFQTEASIDGIIRQSSLPLEPGLPYRSILWIPRFKKFLCTLTEKEHELINHRKRAIERLLPYLIQYV